MNAALNTASVIDLQTPALIATVNVRANPQAVAIDPGSNTALVANTTDNSVSIISLGAASGFTTNPQILQVDPPLVFTSNPPPSVTLTVTGSGYLAGAQIVLDGTAIPTVQNPPNNSRQLTAMIPPSFLTAARRIVVEVQNLGGAFSNVGNILVIQPVAVGTSPRAVAIDPELDVAYVTNSGSGTVTLVDLAPGSVGSILSTVPVGTSPQGVAVLSRTGQAVVANQGSNNASVITVTGMRPAITVRVTNTINNLNAPVGVAINPDTGFAYVSNSGNNSLSAFPATASGTVLPASFSTDVTPGAIAIAPDLNFLVLANEASNTLELFDITNPASPVLRARVQNQFTGAPTGAAYDPVEKVFMGLSSVGNGLVIFNPTANPLQPTAARVGINPTSMAYNFQTSTLLTVNHVSNTISVMDFPNRQVRSILDLSAGDKFAVDIHTRTNLAVVADTLNNRILLVPMPR